MNAVIAGEIDAHRDALADAMTARHFRHHPELDVRYGVKGRIKCREDAAYHLRYLSEAIAADAPGLFADYAAWARVMLDGRGIPVEDLAENLAAMREVVCEALDDASANAVEAYIDQALARLSSQSGDLPTYVLDGAPFAELANRYLHALLQGDRHSASRLVMDAVEGGMAIRDIYLHVFQCAQYEVGRLWQMNKISVAHEHFCTAATQLIMSQLYPHIFSTRKNGRRLVATCVGGDLHELGVRMVADFFEMEGWDTFYLGANTPTDSVVQCAVDRQAHVVGISATMTYHIQAVVDLVAALRRRPECADVKIMVGGYPFNKSPELWQTVGADGTARDASSAIEVVNSFLGQGL